MSNPLAYSMRPSSINDIIGQKHLLGEGKVLKNLIKQKKLYSMIFYGPPGTGKTTTAMAIAEELNRPYRLFNAVTDNKKKLDQLFIEAEMSQGLVVIIDEVHRLNKDKQDILLPHIESGLITMIGATTANPFFSINPAIRSRVHLFEFHPLSNDDLFEILTNATPQDRTLENDVYQHILRSANGDARYSLNILELLLNAYPGEVITKNHLKEINVGMNTSMDKDSDNYYDTLSAFQKSIRGSDVQAALYYLAKLIHVGDFDSIERRLLVIAYEDIGLANPSLCSRVESALSAARKVGFPEARIPISAVVIECALSPKSKSAEHAIDNALALVGSSSYSVPKYLRLKAVGLSDIEMYDYSRSDLWHKIQYLPNTIKDVKFYEPLNLNSAEKVLANNYNELKKFKRSSDIVTLNSSKKS
ncbi:replication-associated recombination protein A [Erysipelothrix urinaevulpis]|uniref:replication-associated recombination protein A n=1 Tax=Erysipelothrix urinaevulpis TaxID=2683717 RepID=UPI00135BC763|nr:replication-associated recombination protein A [Erysipelothrix urinaevulpis]